MPPLQSHSQGQSDSFKVRLSSVVKMQQNHINDKSPHVVTAQGTKPKLPQRAPTGTGTSVPPRKPLPPQVPPKDVPQKPPPPQRGSSAGVYHIGGHNSQNSNKNVAPRSHQQHPRHSDSGYQGNTRRYHGNRTSEDDTESEYSDEDKEYVYYVNASHV